MADTHAGASDADDDFLRHRNLVVRLAYDITGSWADAEDVASQVYLAWRAVGGPVTNPRAYLARMATHKALDTVEARRRVGYVGAWLPEPVLTGPGADEALAQADEVEIALMLVLGSLSPLERAAFLLHDVFAFSHAQIGEILGRDPAAVRQLASRARTHLAERRRPTDVDADHLAATLDAFWAAARRGDLDGLVSHLTEDAVFVGDGGGRVRTALRPVTGAEKVARLLVGLAAGLDRAGVGDGVRFEPIVANRRPGVAIWLDDALDQIVWVLFEDGRIAEVVSVRNPDKLAAVARRLG